MTRDTTVDPVYSISAYSIDLGELVSCDTRYGSGVLGIDMPLKSDPEDRLLFNLGGRSKIIDLTTEKVAVQSDMQDFLSNLESACDESISEGDGALSGMAYDIQNVSAGGKTSVVIGDWDFNYTNESLGGDEVIELNYEILIGHLITLPFG